MVCVGGCYPMMPSGMDVGRPMGHAARRAQRLSCAPDQIRSDQRQTGNHLCVLPHARAGLSPAALRAYMDACMHARRDGMRDGLALLWCAAAGGRHAGRGVGARRGSGRALEVPTHAAQRPRADADGSVHAVGPALHRPPAGALRAATQTAAAMHTCVHAHTYMHVCVAAKQAVSARPPASVVGALLRWRFGLLPLSIEAYRAHAVGGNKARPCQVGMRRG